MHVMFVRVFLSRMLGMFDRMQLMAMRKVCVMAGFLVIAAFSVLSCFAMMFSSFVQMLCRFVVMMMNLVLGAHATLLDSRAPDQSSQAHPAKQMSVSCL